MKKTGVFLIVIFLLELATGCSKDIDDYPKSNLRAISYFSFKPYHNADKNIFVEHVGEIDEVNKVIKVVLPPDVVLIISMDERNSGKSCSNRFYCRIGRF